MAYKRFFCSLSGEDYSIIRKSPTSLINLFFAIGVFVLFIFALCFISLSLLVLNLFENEFLAVIIGAFFAWMITNIYLLILYTLAKNPFRKNTGFRSIILPYIIKYGFIVFISLLVTKPLEVFFFSEDLNQEISVYKKEQLGKYNSLTQEYFDQESAQIRVLLQEEKENPSGEAKNSHYEEMLVQNETRKKELLAKMGILISTSNFYAQKIIFLSKNHPISWLVSLGVTLFFLLPAVIKNFISSKSTFYQLKNEIETRIVLDEYDRFKERYNVSIQNAFGSDYSWIEQYDDPPFNYSRKVEKETVFSEEDFIKSLRHD